jgi:hypothetical protein
MDIKKGDIVVLLPTNNTNCHGWEANPNDADTRWYKKAIVNRIRPPETDCVSIVEVNVSGEYDQWPLECVRKGLLNISLSAEEI